MEEPNEKVQKLQAYIQTVEQAVSVIAKKSSQGDFSPKSIDQIEYLLTNAPDMKAQAYLMLADFRHAYEDAKFETKLIQAKLWQQANIKRDTLNLTSAKDREAYVLTQPEYQEAVRQENELKYRCEQMQAVSTRYEDLHIGVRKLASMMMQEKSNYDQGA